MKKTYMDRDTTATVKGISLIFMFVHHFFTFPSWYVEGISYPELISFASYLSLPFKICVSAFAFLTGYFYFSAREKTFRYSLRKATDILVSYWSVFIPMLIVAVAFGFYKFSPTAFLYELFGMRRPIMVFCWYVYFYCFSMMLLPFITKISGHAPLRDITMVIIFPVAAFTVLFRFSGTGTLAEVFASMRNWFPCIASGYLFAKYSLFENLFDKLIEGFPKYVKLLTWLLMMLLAFIGRYVCVRLNLGSIDVRGQECDLLFTMDMIYGPLFVYGLANLLQYIKGSIFIKPLIRLGGQSLLMWFVHCVFFNVFNTVTQPVLYFLKNPLLVLIFGLAVCYLAAVLVDIPLKHILKLKNKYLFLSSGRYAADIAGENGK